MKKILPTLCLLLCSTSLADADGRQHTITGGLGIRQGYDSNVHQTSDNEVDEWTTALTPTIGLTSASARDTLSLSYAPSVVYNHRLDETNSEHFLDLDAQRSINERLNISLSDTFELGYDSTSRPDLVVLSENQPRNRYWSNSFTAQARNELARDSALVLGYNFALLDNSAADEQDYRRHRPFAKLDYRWNPHWSTGIDGAYTRGDFDQSDDLNEYKAGIEQRYHLDPHRAVTASVDYAGGDYDGNKPGYESVSFQGGYRTELSPFSTLNASLGWTTISRDTGGDDSGLAYSLDYRRRLEKGSLALTGSGGVENQQFDGADNDLSRFWTLQTGLSRELAERLTADGQLQYRVDDYLDHSSSTDQAWEASGALNWSFGRWYTASLRYIYHNLNADIAQSDYTDHRLFVALSAGRDLWKW